LNEDGYWDLPEIREVMSWVRCVQSPVDNFVLSALQTPFSPTQYIKRKLVAQEIRDQISKTGKSAWKLLSEYRGKDDRQTQAVKKFTDTIQRMYAYRSLPAREVVSKVIKEIGALEHYKEESGISPDKDPVASIRELTRISEKHDSLQDFLNYVRKVAGASRNRKGVCLSTVHSFKGREQKNVFFISCNAGLLPHSKSEDELGERCIYYVGLSRAEKILEISYWGAPSPYLRLTKVESCGNLELEDKDGH
jgi:superfamily I DNA/RNA helicase